MTAPLLLIAFATWLAIGVVAAVVMGRLGYASFAWGVLGAVLGPLVVPLAIETVRRQQPGYRRTVTVGRAGPGPAQVLIGVDGSPEATAAARSVVQLMDDRLGRVVLAWVLDYDTASVNMQRGERDRAERSLQQEAAGLRSEFGISVDSLLLAGPPAATLAGYAADEGFTLLAVGSRGRGASKVALGSVATELAAGAPVPVMVVPPAPSARRPAPRAAATSGARLDG